MSIFIQDLVYWVHLVALDAQRQPRKGRACQDVVESLSTCFTVCQVYCWIKNRTHDGHCPANNMRPFQEVGGIVLSHNLLKL